MLDKNHKLNIETSKKQPQTSKIKNTTLNNSLHSNVYGPKERGFFEMEPTTIKAHSENDFSTLPDPVQDPIVSNNISNMEFDYTYGDVLKTPEDDE